MTATTTVQTTTMGWNMLIWFLDLPPQAETVTTSTCLTKKNPLKPFQICHDCILQGIDPRYGDLSSPLFSGCGQRPFEFWAPLTITGLSGVRLSGVCCPPCGPTSKMAAKFYRFIKLSIGTPPAKTNMVDLKMKLLEKDNPSRNNYFLLPWSIFGDVIQT